jgi:hypothetical protein
MNYLKVKEKYSNKILGHKIILQRVICIDLGRLDFMIILVQCFLYQILILFC